MKKIFAVLMAILTIFTACACVEEPVLPAESTPEASQSEFESENYVESESESAPETEPVPSTISICGIDISGFKIIYPVGSSSGEMEAAKRLAEHIESVSGVSVPVEGDVSIPVETEILVGNCNSRHLTKDIRSAALVNAGYKVGNVYASILTVGGKLWVSANNVYTVGAAVDKLIAELTPSEAGRAVELDYSGKNVLCVKAEVTDDPLRVMSYNIYTSSPTVTRGAQLVSNIKSFDPDIIGVQELNTNWINIFKNDFDLFNTYEMVGKPRLWAQDLSNNNEYSAIFYKKDKFNLIDTNTYWLSDTPFKVSKYSDTQYYRIMTYAVLERKSDGKLFIHVNTHLSGESSVGHKQVDVLLSMTDKLLSKYGDLPIYFTGDFNMIYSDAGHSKITGWGMVDSRGAYTPTNNESTCGNSIIDYCFISKNDFYVLNYDVGFGLEGSDHNLVYVELFIK